MERAFRFLKRTSVSGGGAGEDDGVSAAAKGGVVLSGDAAGELPGEPIGDGFASTRCSGSSCAKREDVIKIERNNAQLTEKKREAVISVADIVRH